MGTMNSESELHSGAPFDDIVAGTPGVRRFVKAVETVAPRDSTGLIQEEAGIRKEALYQAVIALSRSIAGRSDLRSLLSDVADSLRPIVSFDHLGLILHDPHGNAMQGYILNEPCNPTIASLRLPVEEDPAGWVWLNQEPLVISRLQSDTRWPEFARRARGFRISTLVLVPLTTGDHRLGAFGFGSVAPFDPGPAEIPFLERIASEFAVAVQAYLAKQEVIRERETHARQFFALLSCQPSTLLHCASLFHSDTRLYLAMHWNWHAIGQSAGSSKGPPGALLLPANKRRPPFLAAAR